MSQLYMLDTDVSSYLIKGTSPAVEARLLEVDPALVCISAVTRAELRFGVRRLQKPSRIAREVDFFLSGIRSLPWDDAAADQFAGVRVELERSGTPIGVMDTMIAAHARSVKATLVTNNLKHFRLVKGLTVENWAHSTSSGNR